MVFTHGPSANLPLYASKFMVASQIDSKKCSEELRSLLVDAYIDKVEYFITGWNLRFVHASKSETRVYCAELTTADANCLRDFLRNSPIDLTAGNEPEDTVTAAVLFSIVNSFPLVRLDVAETGTMNLEFANGQRLATAGTADGADISWEVELPNDIVITCSFGEIFRSAQ